MGRFKSGDSVCWRSATGRTYSGRVYRLASATAAQVISRDGFRWLLPLAELTGTSARVS